jgi:hypothetical protein
MALKNKFRETNSLSVSNRSPATTSSAAARAERCYAATTPKSNAGRISSCRQAQTPARLGGSAARCGPTQAYPRRSDPDRKEAMAQADQIKKLETAPSVDYDSQQNDRPPAGATTRHPNATQKLVSDEQQQTASGQGRAVTPPKNTGVKRHPLAVQKGSAASHSQSTTQQPPTASSHKLTEARPAHRSCNSRRGDGGRIGIETTMGSFHPAGLFGIRTAYNFS